MLAHIEIYGGEDETELITQAVITDEEQLAQIREVLEKITDIDEQGQVEARGEK